VSRLKHFKPDAETMAIVIYQKDGYCVAFVGVHLQHGRAFTIADTIKLRSATEVYSWLKTFGADLPIAVFVEEGYAAYRKPKKGEENHA
jgi:hypothetical protein